MRKKLTPRAPLPVIGPADDPQSLYHQMRQYLEWHAGAQLQRATVSHREGICACSSRWCESAG